MIVLGLTGSIGMGKSTVARQLRALGVPVFDADAAVHRLIGLGGTAVPLLQAAFPTAVSDGKVDRARLGALAFADPQALADLETILHPLVRRAEGQFLRLCRRRRRRLAALEIPLLFETGAERFVDAVLVVSCPRFLQSQRVLARPGMTAARLDAIRGRQWDDRIKRRRADFVVPSGLGRRPTLGQVKRALMYLVTEVHHHRPAKAFP